MTRSERIAALKAAAKERVLVLDGSWGVMIQKRGLAEADYRGERFQDHPGQLKGDNDLLCITRPDIIADLHEQYFAAGADISETNTFSATSRCPSFITCGLNRASSNSVTSCSALSARSARCSTARTSTSVGVSKSRGAASGTLASSRSIAA